VIPGGGRAARGPAPVRRTPDDTRPTACHRATDRRRGSHSAGGDDGTHTLNTLSADATRVHVFYPFHPLHGLSLRVVRRPRREDGAVCVIDPTERRLKIPVWMVSPEAADLHIVPRAHVSQDALLRLISLLATARALDGRGHATLPHTGGDGRKGGDRATTPTHGPDDPTRGRPRGDRCHETHRVGRSHGPHAGHGLSRHNRKERS
jgi:hypothetical protein